MYAHISGFLCVLNRGKVILKPIARRGCFFPVLLLVFRCNRLNIYARSILFLPLSLLGPLTLQATHAFRPSRFVRAACSAVATRRACTFMDVWAWQKKKHGGKQNIQSRCPGLSMVDLCGTSINPEAFARSDGDGEGGVIQGGAPLPWHTY